MVGRETATQFAYYGTGGVDVDIDAGSKVKVDASLTEFGGNGAGVADDAVAAALCRGFSGHGWREAVADAHSRYVPPFLVDADEEGGIGVFLQIAAKGMKLTGREYIAVTGAGGGVVFEEDYVADVIVAQVADNMVFFGDGGATETDKEHFAYVASKLFVATDGLGFEAFGLGAVALSAGGKGESHEDWQD